jgi:hypothetical protein
MISPLWFVSLDSSDWQVFPTVPADDVLKQIHQLCSLIWLQMAKEFAIILVVKLSQDRHEPPSGHRKFDRLVASVTF